MAQKKALCDTLLSTPVLPLPDLDTAVDCKFDPASVPTSDSASNQTSDSTSNQASDSLIQRLQVPARMKLQIR